VFATFSAVIPKIISFYSNESFYPDKNFIRHIGGDGFNVNILIKGNLVYIAVSKYKESAGYLKQMLEYLHVQMISLVTN
jgi:hypothetical protein